MELRHLLDHHPVFMCLDEKDQRNVELSAITKTYHAEEWIAHRGQTWPFLFCVADGVVQAVKESAEGRSLLVVELGEGDIFWGLSFFISDAPMPVALIASQQSTLFLWSLEDLKPILYKNGEMSWELSRLMILKMQYASSILDEFAFQPITGRLARLLLDHFGRAVEDYVSRDMTLEDMASRIGSTREMVCRQLYKMADQGIIEITRTELKITDLDALHGVADLQRGGGKMNRSDQDRPHE